MKIGEIVELAYSKILGGLVTPQVKVSKIEVRSYIPAAINFSITKQYYINKKDENTSSLPTEFIASFDNVPVLENKDRGKKYFVLPEKLIALPANAGIASVSPMKSNEQFKRLTNQFQDSGYEKQMANIVRYWIEGNNVFFKNLPDSVNKVLVRMMASINIYDNDADAPIPAGLEAEVIDIVVGFFTGQRQIQEDDTPNFMDEKINK